MTRKPSVFYTEKRVLTMFPFWLVVLVLIVVTLLSFLPYKFSSRFLQSSFSKTMTRTIMRQRGISI